MIERIGLVALVVGIACSASSGVERSRPRFVKISDLPKLAPKLEGKYVSTSGFVRMSDRFQYIASEPNYSRTQICIGLIVDDDEFKSLQPYDGQWKTVAGYFGGHHCVGNELCTASCGPDAIENPKLVGDPG